MQLFRCLFLFVTEGKNKALGGLVVSFLEESSGTMHIIERICSVYLIRSLDMGNGFLYNGIINQVQSQSVKFNQFGGGK